VRRQNTIRVTVAIGAIGAAALFGSLAGAADTDVKQKLASAREEASRITGRINAEEATIAELQQQADVAAARSDQLLAQLRESTARSTALNDDLLGAEMRLALVRRRYKRAVGVLADRLVEIYKGSDVDLLSVILNSESYEDLEGRSEYLQALTDADQAIADRVSGLRDGVEAAYRRIAGPKADIDRESRRLETARTEIDRARSAARSRASRLADAKASEEADLRGLQSKISGWELEVRKQAAEDLGGGAFLGGPYSIPTYIVICESGGNYHALNPSSGAGGAYQILPSTWIAYGGHGLPQNASKADQDRIAARTWADVGASAWSCA
jgi:septal ring factor EnvC (AmiA/AmiB activator)